MEKTFKEILEGYRLFREKYTVGDNSIMKYLSAHGQKPQIMLVSCCDSRVDPALILQCDPGDLFVARNVANIVPPYEKDEALHGTSAALEFGICLLNVRHLILLGHSQCAGIAALLNSQDLSQNDFITKWVSSIKIPEKLVDKVTEFEIEIEQDKKGKFRVEIMAKTPHNLYRAEETTESIEGSTDKVIDELEVQIDKKKSCRRAGPRSPIRRFSLRDRSGHGLYKGQQIYLVDRA